MASIPIPHGLPRDLERALRDIVRELGRQQNGSGGDLEPHAATHLLGGSDEITTLPSSAQKGALSGTHGAPASGNPYVTDSDPRNTNARTPTSHTHPISEVTALQAALDDKQDLDAQLSALAALSPSGFNEIPFFTSPTSAALIMLGATGGDLLQANNPTAARTFLELGSLALANAINNSNWSGTDLAIANGGTGASTAADARSNLAAAHDADPRFPTSNQKAALAGSHGSPSDGNRYVTQSDPAFSGAGDVPVGAILPFGGISAPSGYLLCDGSAVNRTTFADLFAVLGTAYGAGNGSSTFNVPDLRGRVPAGVDGGAGRISSNNTRGASGGLQTHTLTTAQLPSHSHGSGTLAASSGGAHTHGSGTLSTASDGAHSHTTISNQASNTSVGGAATRVTNLTNHPTGNQSGSTSTDGAHTHSISGSTASDGAHGHSITGSTATAGSGSAHNNLQPYQVVNYIVKT